MESIIKKISENIDNWDISQLFAPDFLILIIRITLLLILGIPVVYIISKWSRVYITRYLSAQRGMIVGKAIHYSGLMLILVMILREFGFELGPLLGAAGILGIAVGFASQTSVSNIISGIFLITEHSFVVGDIINIGNTTGKVLSIDLLSVKLRTFDNKFVRIPNETILKSEVTTLTHFPVRRVDLIVSVAYKENLKRVKEILLDIADHHPLCLQEPLPLIMFERFANSSIDLKFAVWAAREDWFTLKNEMYEQIKSRFDQEGIEIPFPHVSLYHGSASDPIPIKMINDKTL